MEQKLAPGCLLRQDEKGYWSSGNQVSTYEIISRLGQQHTHLDREARAQWIRETYLEIKGDQAKYGSYAGNNSWSPRFTTAQLVAFVERCQWV